MPGFDHCATLLLSMVNPVSEPVSRLELIDGVVVFSPDRDADAHDLASTSASTAGQRYR
jgi:hypothetical protein